MIGTDSVIFLLLRPLPLIPLRDRIKSTTYDVRGGDNNLDKVQLNEELSGLKFNWNR